MPEKPFFPSILIPLSDIMSDVPIFPLQVTHVLVASTGCRDSSQFTVAAEYFQMAADLNDANSANNFGCYLEQGQVVDLGIGRSRILGVIWSLGKGLTGTSFQLQNAVRYGMN
jgi:hypothetical protein